MKQIAITIPNNRTSFFLKMMKSLSFVKEVEIISETNFPEYHKSIIDKRLNHANNNPEAFESWDAVHQELSSTL